MCRSNLSLLLEVLFKGEKHAILASSENNPLLKLLLIALVNDLLKTFATAFISFISFSRMLFIPVNLLLSIFLNFFYIISRNL